MSLYLIWLFTIVIALLFSFCFHSWLAVAIGISDLKPNQATSFLSAFVVHSYFSSLFDCLLPFLKFPSLKSMYTKSYTAPHSSLFSWWSAVAVTFRLKIFNVFIICRERRRMKMLGLWLNHCFWPLQICFFVQNSLFRAIGKIMW